MRTLAGSMALFCVHQEGKRKTKHGRNVYTITELNFVFTSAFSVTLIDDMLFKRLKDRLTMKQAIFRIISGRKDI